MTYLDALKALGTLAFMALVLFFALGMSIWMPWVASNTGWL